MLTANDDMRAWAGSLAKGDAKPAVTRSSPETPVASAEATDFGMDLGIVGVTATEWSNIDPGPPSAPIEVPCERGLM